MPGSREFIRVGTVVVWIKLDDHGDLELAGQDLGGYPGSSEYEYFITAPSKDFSTIRAALGGGPDDDIVELLCQNATMIFEVGEKSWLESLGIEVTFSSWIR